MHRIVVGIRAVIAFFDEAEQPPGLSCIQLEMRNQSIGVEEMNAQHGQAATCMQKSMLKADRMVNWIKFKLQLQFCSFDSV